MSPPCRRSVVVPAWNEPKSVIESAASKLGPYFGEIIVVENDDKRTLFDVPGVRIIHMDRRGIGLALRTGLSYTTFRHAYIVGADVPMDLSFVDKAETYLDEGWGAIIGSKYHPDSVVARPLSRRMASFVYNNYVETLHSLKITDYGMPIAGFDGDLLKSFMGKFKSDGIGFYVEVAKALRRNRAKVMELPIVLNDMRNRGLVQWFI